MDGLFKNIAEKVLNHYSDKTINESGLTEAQKWAAKEQIDQGIDLVSTNFEDNAKSGIKTLVAVIAGFPTGDPILALGAGLKVASREAAINHHKFISAAIARGIPVTVDGQIVNPPSIEENENVIKYSAIAIGGGGVLLVGSVLYWMFSD